MITLPSRGGSPLDDTEARASRAGEALAGAAGGRPARVLVVDSDDFVQRRIRRLLSRAGCTLRSADGVDDALAALAEGVDLLVVDVEAEDGQGRALVDRVERAHPGLRVLLLSGPAWDGPDPGRPLLRKPFGSTQLLEAAARVLVTAP